ncbi:MAG: amidase, hydantoinase/carbamoylase family [Firmicutes bacterium]|nr:amidase, hydantoinase/carbamoylase family [Bacillota bacterium]
MDKQWIIDTIGQFAKIGIGEKGITRLAFSDEEQQAKEYATKLMQQAGLVVRVDAAGNVIGRLEGTAEDAKVVLTGSHLDTPPDGGRYDGVVGVVGGLAAIKELMARGPLDNHVELVVFSAEESSRFGYATIGSKAMVGLANPAMWNRAKDQDGMSLNEAAARLGFSFADLKDAIQDAEKIKAFVELHIEGGPLLERTQHSIGIVEAIAAPTRLRIVIDGQAAHSGSTPMDERQDALVSAAMIVLAVQEIALGHQHEGTVATVGIMRVFPNAMNVVPGRVELGVDIRGVNHSSVIDTLQDIKDAISTIADGQETPVSIEVLVSEKPVVLDDDLVLTVEGVCHELELSFLRMNSGAGHDTMNMARIVPAGLIFIPCHEGISHNIDEYAAPEDILNGVAVLTETLYKLAK